MRLVAERSPLVDAHGLEGRTSAQERAVVRMDDRRRRVDDTAAARGDGEQAHAATPVLGLASLWPAPIAASSGRALTHDSSTSWAGSESATMPPPTQR